MADNTHRNAIKAGHHIGAYEILEILGQGGFGITYLAMDTNLQRKVAIKEYLPVELAVREADTSVHPVSGEHGEEFSWGLERFISEAQTLARFKHPNIVSVLAVIRENNTAYIIMEYEQGRPFSDLLKGKKTIAEEQLKNIAFPVMAGLEAIHNAGFIHRDIKPPNIYIRADHSPVLIDFGSARQSLLQHTRTLTTLVSPGFAPFEQYVGKSDKQGPWTDIYGLGATLYRSVTGLSPADSMERSESLLHTGRDIYVNAAEIAKGKYTPAFLTAIDRAMAFKADDRPRTIAAWRSIFEGQTPDIESSTTTSEAATVAVDIPTVKTDMPVQPGFFSRMLDGFNRIVWKAVRWGLALLVILIIARILLPGNRQRDIQDTPAPETVQQQPLQSEQVETRSDNKPPAGAAREVVVDRTEPALEPEPTPRTADTQPQQAVVTDTDSAVLDAASSINRLPAADRRRLQSIRERLKANRNDRQARRELNVLAGEFEEKIRQSVKNGSYDQARAYLYAVRENADKNSRAYQELEDLLAVINKMEKRGSQ